MSSIVSIIHIDLKKYLFNTNPVDECVSEGHFALMFAHTSASNSFHIFADVIAYNSAYILFAYISSFRHRRVCLGPVHKRSAMSAYIFAHKLYLLIFLLIYCLLIFPLPDIDECASDPCTNEVRCLDGIGFYSCVCVQGWGGVNCGQRKYFVLFIQSH